MSRVFLAEDELIIAMLVEDIIIGMGHQIARHEHTLESAVEAARNEDIDVAILDVNLSGKSSFPVAEILLERGIPFVFATGYGPDGTKGRFSCVPVLQKPFETRELAAAFSIVLRE